MRITWFEEAWDDYENWQTQDKKILKRINQLLHDTQRNGYGGIGKPEPLKGALKGFWSKRIDDVHRLVFRINGDVLEILACKGHYDD